MKKYCKKCGYTTIEETLNVCPICKSMDWEDADLITLKEISNDKEFLEAMIKLKKNDPIEYQLKMSQFKNQLQQQENNNQAAQQDTSVPKCPTCGSTNIEKISGIKRWVTTGLFGVASGDLGKTMVCRNCGFKF